MQFVWLLDESVFFLGRFVIDLLGLIVWDYDVWVHTANFVVWFISLQVVCFDISMKP